MSYLLYTGQMVEALVRADHPHAAEFERRLFDFNREVALELGAHLGVSVTPSDDPAIFDGTFDAAFGPAFDGQAMPEVLEGYDTTSEWGE